MSLSVTALLPLVRVFPYMQASDAVLLALGRYAHANLTDLDVSWCRAMSNEGLGFVADSCTSLRRMRIYGCSQVRCRAVHMEVDRHC